MGAGAAVAGASAAGTGAAGGSSQAMGSGVRLCSSSGVMGSSSSGAASADSTYGSGSTSGVLSNVDSGNDGTRIVSPDPGARFRSRGAVPASVDCTMDTLVASRTVSRGPSGTILTGALRARKRRPKMAETLSRAAG